MRKSILALVMLLAVVSVVQAGKVNYTIYGSCVSDSMMPTFGCHDKLIVNTVNPQDVIIKGDIYCYQKGIYGRTRVLVCHRFIRYEESKLVFLGDNNAFEDDLVNRRTVSWKIINY